MTLLQLRRALAIIPTDYDDAQVVTHTAQGVSCIDVVMLCEPLPTNHDPFSVVMCSVPADPPGMKPPVLTIMPGTVII